MWVGPSSYIACGRKCPRRSSEILVDDDPSVELHACFLGKLQTWSNADAYNHQIGLDRSTFLQADGLFVDGSDFVFEVKDNAVLLMEAADKVTHIGAENPLHRPLIRRHDVDLQFRVRRAAATSSPIKLAPMTTTRRAALACSMMAWQSASERSVRTCG